MSTTRTLCPLTIGNHTSRLPFVQGGMGVGISLAGLASAVANEGGVGVISTAIIGFAETDLHDNYREANIRALRREIRTARTRTKGVLGVNIMVALTNYEDMVRTAAEEGIDIIFCGAGLPLDLPALLPPDSACALAPIISSARAAKVLAKRWLSRFGRLPDAFVLEGPLAGGHLGFSREQVTDPGFCLTKLLGEVLEALQPLEQKHGVQIPVIAAGGIYTGQDISDMLGLGAAGVQMGTRFVTTHECDADPKFKEAYLAAKEQDLVIIDSPVGLPGRSLQNAFLSAVSQGKKKPFKCPYHCLVTCKQKDSPYCIAAALINAVRGRLEKGFAFAGQNAFRSEALVSVKCLIRSLLEEFQAALPLTQAASVNCAAAR
ncbi:MAG: nitronate monooxygenase family protein [Deltaproteobacteria bacterium]|nr:nitronate monooxygenase family protein [Deltaproteobacteria bacterium]